MRRQLSDYIPHLCILAIVLTIGLWVMATMAHNKRVHALVGQPRAAAIELLGLPHRSEMHGNTEVCEWDTRIQGTTTYVNTGGGVLMPITAPDTVSVTVLTFVDGKCTNARKR